MYNEDKNSAPADPADDAFSMLIGLLRDLNAGTTIDDVLQAYSYWSCRIMDCEATAIALVDADGLLRRASVEGKSRGVVGTPVDLKDNFLGQSFVNRKMHCVTDLSIHPELDCRHFHEKGMGAIVNAPLVTKDRCFGAIGLVFASGEFDVERTMFVVDALATSIATQLLVLETLNRLSDVARTDSLTGAYNRYHYKAAIEICWHRLRKEATEFAILSIDLDHFKAINDTYGHAAGDAVLVAVTDRMKSMVRGSDCVVRMGGEEFVMLLNHVNRKEAEAMAHRILGEIAQTSISVDGSELSVTASIGVTISTQWDQTHSDVLQRADKALYAAKSGGRNQVVFRESDNQMGQESCKTEQGRPVGRPC